MSLGTLVMLKTALLVTAAFSLHESFHNRKGFLAAPLPC